MGMRLASFVWVTISLIFVFGCTPAPKLPEQKPLIQQLGPYVKRGVRDISKGLTKKLGGSVRLLSATCDERPTWHDGSPVFSLRVRFEAAGSYVLRFKRPGGQSDVTLRTYELKTGSSTSEESKFALDVWHGSGPKVLPVSVGQDVLLTWKGLGGRVAAFARESEWKLDSLALSRRK